MQDGRNMAAILKNLKIALTSLILVRFTPFFHQNAQKLKMKNVGPQICEISRDLAKIQDRDRRAICIPSECNFPLFLRFLTKSFNTVENDKN